MNIERFFGGRTVLGLRTQDRPARGVGAPTLPPPTKEAPTSVQDQNVSQALKKALGNSGDVFEQPRKTKNRLLTNVALTVGTLLALAGGVWGINKIRGDDEPTPQAASQTQGIDSFPNSFNDGSSPKLEGLPPHHMELSPAIDPKHPERINMLSPIKLPTGSENRRIKVEKDVDWMGGGVRHIIDSEQPAERMPAMIKNAFIIKDGLKDGDILVAPIGGTISSGGTIKGEDQAGNAYTIMMGGHFKLEYIKEIPPSRSEKVGPGQYRTIESHVPIEQGELIAIIRNPSKGIIGPGGRGGTGQMYVYAFSTVQLEDGIKQQGAADIVINNLPSNTIFSK